MLQTFALWLQKIALCLQKISLWFQKIVLLFEINCTEINQSQSSNIFMYIIIIIIIGSIIRYQPVKTFKNGDSLRPLTAPFALSLNLCYTLLLAIVPILTDLLGDKTQS